MKANFIIIKMLVHMRVIVEIAIGYIIENIKGFGEKGRKKMDLLKIIKHYRLQTPNKETSRRTI